MHYAFDVWMAREFPGCPFERSADDVIVHCTNTPGGGARAGPDRHADAGGGAHAAPRQDEDRLLQGQQPSRPSTSTSPFVPGFAFRPREAVNGTTGEQFTSFSPAISPEALQAKGGRLREMRIHRRTDLTLNALATWLNPIVAGWMRYYGRFYRSALAPLLRRVSFYLRRWAGNKYKRLRTHQRFQRWWTGLQQRRARTIRPLATDPLVLTEPVRRAR